MNERYSFIIPIASLQEKVEKHTSVLGAHRSVDGYAHLQEQLSLTEGEGFLFEDYMKEAVAKTYNWIRAFGRNLPDGFCYFRGLTRHVANTYDAVSISLNESKIGDMFASIPLTNDMYSVARNGAQHAVVISLPDLQIHKGDAVIFSYRMRVYYTTIADNLFEDQCVYESVASSSADVELNEVSFTTTISQDDFDTTIKRVDSIAITVDGVTAPQETFVKGEMIDVVLNGVHQYGIQRVTSGKVDVSHWYNDDISESIVFNIELREWQDRNMLPVAGEHLEDALLNYIMYKWLEVSYPKEAEAYKDKWEEHAHSAQIALNAERRILQRKGVWL